MRRVIVTHAIIFAIHHLSIGDYFYVCKYPYHPVPSRPLFIFVSCGRCDLLLQSKMSHDLKHDNNMTTMNIHEDVHYHENITFRENFQFLFSLEFQRNVNS